MCGAYLSFTHNNNKIYVKYVDLSYDWPRARNAILNFSISKFGVGFPFAIGPSYRERMFVHSAYIYILMSLVDNFIWYQIPHSLSPKLNTSKCGSKYVGRKVKSGTYFVCMSLCSFVFILHNIIIILFVV